jgi:hypothetical protein
MRMSLALLVAVLAACGTDPSEEPVEVKPLQGQLNGALWAAGGAVVRGAADDGEKTVYIHPDVGLTCSQYGDEPYLVAVVPWAPGVVKLGLDSPATVYFYFDNAIHLVFDGRIEVMEAPTEIGAMAPFRIRADFLDSDDDLHAEGEITVTICE